MKLLTQIKKVTGFYQTVIIISILVTGNIQVSKSQDSTWTHVNIGVSTQGIAAAYETNWKPDSRFSYKVYGSYFRYVTPQDLTFDEGSILTISPTIRKFHAGVKAYYLPFRNQKWVSLVGGVGVDIRQTYRLFISTETGLNSGGLIIDGKDFGIIDADIQWQAVMPYLGMRFSSSPVNHRFTVGGEIGVFYMGSPSLRVDYEGFLETTTLDEQVIQIQRNMRGYSYFPFVEFSLGYRLR
jgi:hypothetical protein